MGQLRSEDRSESGIRDGMAEKCLLVVVFNDRLERVVQPVALWVEQPDGQ